MDVACDELQISGELILVTSRLSMVHLLLSNHNNRVVDAVDSMLVKMMVNMRSWPCSRLRNVSTIGVADVHVHDLRQASTSIDEDRDRALREVTGQLEAIMTG